MGKEIDSVSQQVDNKTNSLQNDLENEPKTQGK